MNKLNSDRFAGVEIVLIVIVLLIAGVASGAVWAIENADDGKNDVIYNANNETNDSKTYLDAKFIEDIMFSSPGHIFYAWCDQPDGKGNMYNPHDTVESDLDLYAVWITPDAKGLLQKVIDNYGDGIMGPFKMDSSSTDRVSIAYGPKNVQEDHLQEISISIGNASEIKDRCDSGIAMNKNIAGELKAIGAPVIEITSTFGLTDGYGLYYSGPTTEGNGTMLMYCAYKGGEMIGVAYSIDTLNDFSVEDAKALIDVMAKAIA